MPKGLTPKDAEDRVRRAKPAHDWTNAPGVGWQHGDSPQEPDGLKPASVEAWKTWMGAWFAAYWKPEDLPGLRTLILIYDQVERGEYQRASELRLQMDTYGITPKGQQDRRWKPPLEEPEKKKAAGGSRYQHLRAVQ